MTCLSCYAMRKNDKIELRNGGKAKKHIFFREKRGGLHLTN